MQFPTELLEDDAFCNRVSDKVVEKYYPIDIPHAENLCQLVESVHAGFLEAAEAGTPRHLIAHRQFAAIFLLGYESALLQLAERRPD